MWEKASLFTSSLILFVTNFKIASHNSMAILESDNIFV